MLTESPTISEPQKEPEKVIIGYIPYTIKKGDTLYDIARNYNVTTNDIQKANLDKIKDQGLIMAGETIRIPQFGTEDELAESNGLPKGYIRGIDISEYQGNIDWDLLEAAYNRKEFSYIIIRICENINSRQEREFCLDKKFEENLTECNKRGIPYGFYTISRGTTEEEINKETRELCAYIKNNLTGIKGDKDLTFNPSMPIYMDPFEDPNGAQYKMLERGEYFRCANIIDTWCKNMEDEGLYPGVYLNNNHRLLIGYTEKGQEILDNYPLWVASYPTSNTVSVKDCQSITVPFDGSIISQQVTCTGRVDGISGNVDASITDEKIINRVIEYRKNNKIKTKRGVKKRIYCQHA